MAKQIKLKPPPQDETRQSLLQAAKILFARHGYEGTSVKDLADHAGVNVSLVSYHFDGKEGLYRTCLSQFGHERLATAERILQAPATREEFKIRFKMFVEEVFRCHIAEPELAIIVHREIEQELPLIPDLFKETLLKVFETAMKFLQAAQKKKFIRSDLDPQQATGMLFGSMFHFCTCDHIGKKYFGQTIQDPKHREEVIETIICVFLNGLEAK